ncbi:hypothetical protein TX24_25330 [Pseudomonas lactis]|nr:hypothetical protein TX24_25330 [Pseudomonas lactis]
MLKATKIKGGSWLACEDVGPATLMLLTHRFREQASSHSSIVGCQVGKHRLAGRHRRQASSHI